MPYYRLYYFNGCGGIERFREFEATDDLAAVRQAAEWRGMGSMELWSGARKLKAWGSASWSRARDPRRIPPAVDGLSGEA